MKGFISISNWLYYILLFIVLFVFYSYIHPLVPFCTDDWGNMTLVRGVYPSMSQWNPTKIFPECLEPLVAMVAAYFVTPIIGDYVAALIFSNAFVLSFFITIYLYSSQKFLEYRFHLGKLTCYMIIALFAILHFLILRSHWSNNDFLWHATDVNCFYHYIIPTLLCASLVMWLMRHNVADIKDIRTIALLVLVSYLALFSNLYSSVVLVAYCGSMLLMNLIEDKKQDNNWIRKYVRQNSYFLAIVFLWLIIQLMEATGIRAKAYGHMEDPFMESLFLTIKNFFTIHYSLKFIGLTVLIIAAAKIMSYMMGNRQFLHIGKEEVIVVLSLLLTSAYLILLSSKVDANYIQKGNAIFSFAFYYLILTILCVGYLCAKIKYFKVLLPFLVLFSFYESNTQGSVYRDVLQEFGYEAKSYIDFNHDIIRQVCMADAMGQDTCLIKVPEFSRPGKYPLSNDCSEYVGLALHKHNIVSRYIVTKFDAIEEE